MMSWLVAPVWTCAAAAVSAAPTRARSCASSGCPTPFVACSSASPRASEGEMRVLTVHPSRLMYSKIYLRLEPLGLELVAAAAREAGHDVRLIDL